MKNKYLQVAHAVYGYNEYLNLIKVLISGRWNHGKYSDIFAKKLSSFLGNKYTILVNSGSSANLLAVAALTSKTLGQRALKSGDEFITTPLCFPTTINPALIYGLKPVFVDINLSNLNIDVEEIEKAVTKKTKLIMFAHTLGLTPDMERLTEICRKNNIWLVEDCADALGSEYNNKKAGTFGDIATSSFYPAHHISAIEGGMFTTNNPLLYKIAMSFRDWGRHCWCAPNKDNTCKKRFGWKLGELPFGYDHKYTYSEIGYNLKFTEFQAAVGSAQADRLKEFIKKRRFNFQYITKRITNRKIALITSNQYISWFGIPIFTDDRLRFVKYLESNGIGTRLIFAGNITKHPGYLHLKTKKMPNCDFVMDYGLWIGCHPALSKKDLDYIVKTINNYD